MFGDIGYVENYLFLRRDHDECYVRSKADKLSKLKWFNPKAKNMALSSQLTGLSKFNEYVKAIVNSPIPFGERLQCLFFLFEWIVRRGLESFTKQQGAYSRKMIRKYRLSNSSDGDHPPK